MAEPATPIGRVTPEERDLIQSLHLRKLGLGELAASLSRIDDELTTSKLYGRLVEDMGAVVLESQRWWDAIAEQYGWPRQPGQSWRIDFESCAIYLEESSPG